MEKDRLDKIGRFCGSQIFFIACLQFGSGTVSDRPEIEVDETSILLK